MKSIHAALVATTLFAAPAWAGDSAPATCAPSVSVETAQHRSPERLEALLTLYDAAIRERLATPPYVPVRRPIGMATKADQEKYRIEDELVAKKTNEWLQIQKLIDSEAGQRDAWVSRLFWYTSLDEAKDVAKASGKPILYLQMLGKLTDEVSCANSRFFRTTLYSNEMVSSYMHHNFILCWESVRPVPVVTIDYGDGRRIERTITGNGAHMILDMNGRPVDAIPGLYDAHTFFAMMDAAHDAAVESATLPEAKRVEAIRNFHCKRAALLQDEFGRLVNAMRLYSRKASDLVESDWQRLAFASEHRPALDENSLRLIEIKNPPSASEAMDMAFSKTFIESSLVRMTRNLEGNIALDTAKNEYLLHKKVHDWFTSGKAPEDPAALGDKVYTELFLTPPDDPWLGMNPPDVYAALPGNGVVEPSLSYADITSDDGSSIVIWDPLSPTATPTVTPTPSQ